MHKMWRISSSSIIASPICGIVSLDNIFFNVGDTKTHQRCTNYFPLLGACHVDTVHPALECNNAYKLSARRLNKNVVTFVVTLTATCLPNLCSSWLLFSYSYAVASLCWNVFTWYANRERCIRITALYTLNCRLIRITTAVYIQIWLYKRHVLKYLYGVNAAKTLWGDNKWINLKKEVFSIYIILWSAMHKNFPTKCR